ncbi:MAG: prepilin-type N-terminal cleavage/methylation domain-containing protein [Chloroflexi bacterium]|nr:prepilin-type N-terminal cleavage/methylation domain-containing protein [Chloroflexota bacterium]
MKSKAGFTLLETVVALAIVAMIALGATATTGHTLRVTKLNKEWSTVVRQTQNAGYWVSHDALMATTIMVYDPPNASNETIIMKWSDWENGDLYTATYFLTGSKLERRYRITDRFESVVLKDIRTLIAEDLMDFTPELVSNNSTLTLSVEASSGTKHTTRNYEVTPRLLY